MEKQVAVLVPEEWLKSLLQNAVDFESAEKTWEYGNPVNDKINFKAVSLMGYAKSAESILKNNQRVEI